MRVVSLDSHGEPATAREKRLLEVTGDGSGTASGRIRPQCGTERGIEKHRKNREPLDPWCAALRRKP